MHITYYDNYTNYVLRCDSLRQLRKVGDPGSQALRGEPLLKGCRQGSARCHTAAENYKRLLLFADASNQVAPCTDSKTLAINLLVMCVGC